MKFKDFKVFKIKNLEVYSPSFGRKDLYRICIIKGESTLFYQDKKVDLSGTYLFFGNLNTPYSWVIESNDQSGYGCLFTEDFLLESKYFETIYAFSVFEFSEIPVFAITDEKQVESIEFIFEQMIKEFNSDYLNRMDLMRSFINVLIHQGRIIVQSYQLENFSTEKKASKRIYTQFTRLLDAQFPVQSKIKSVQLKTVTDFADKLGLHPNYLNRVVKKESGKTVLKIINDRIITESKILLQHTDWSISEISYSLGFEYPSYFDHVFKRISGFNPRAYREQI